MANSLIENPLPDIEDEIATSLAFLSLLLNANQEISEQLPRPLDTFTCFNKLPLELRARIWKATLPGPRLIVFSPNLSRKVLALTALPDRHVFLWLTKFAFESRRVARKHSHLFKQIVEKQKLAKQLGNLPEYEFVGSIYKSLAKSICLPSISTIRCSVAVMKGSSPR